MQVGDIRKERQEWNRPEDLKNKQEVQFLRAFSSPADLAAQIVAGSVSGAIALYKHNAIEYAEANQYIARAHRLFESSMLAPSVFTASENVTNLPIAEHYPSNSYLDDLFWAATWMLRSSLLEYGSFPDRSSKNLAYYYVAMRTTFKLAFAERDSMAVSLDYLNNVALVHAAVVTKDWSFHSAAQSWIWDWICSGSVKYTTFGRAHHPESMMLGDTTMAAAIAAVYVNAARKWKTAELNDYFLTGAAVSNPLHCDNAPRLQM
jgi:Glycosyl hydrolase family 9